MSRNYINDIISSPAINLQDDEVKDTLRSKKENPRMSLVELLFLASKPHTTPDTTCL